MAENGTGVRSAVDKALSVLEAVVEHERLNEIAAAARLPKSTVHRILQELGEHDYVRTDGAGRYAAGPRILTLAGHVLSGFDPARVAGPALRDLQQRTGHTVHYALRSGDEAVYVEKIEGSQRPYQMASRIGGLLQLHCTSIGKAILANLPAEDVRQIVERTGLERRTAHTIVTLGDLEAELERIRTSGFSIDDEENEAGVRCVGAPVLDHRGRVAGGISVSALAFEVDRAAAEAMAPLVVEAAREISAGMGASPERAGAGTAVGAPPHG